MRFRPLPNVATTAENSSPKLDVLRRHVPSIRFFFHFLPGIPHRRTYIRDFFYNTAESEAVTTKTHTTQHCRIQQRKCLGRVAH